MRKSCFISAFVLLAVSYSVLGQERETRPVKKLVLSDVSIQYGLHSERGRDASVTEFKALAPQSVLLNANLSGFSQSGGFYFSGSTLFRAALGFQFRNDQKNGYKPNPLMRVGIIYFSGPQMGQSFYKTDRKTYDTLRSSQSGQMVFLDSVSTENYGMDYSSEQLRLDVSTIFRTNPEGRWSWFGGIGVTAGFSINANTEISHGQSTRTETRQPGGNTYFSSYNFFSHSGNYQTERYNNKNGIGISVYMPLGIDFRIGRRNEFWKMTHLFYEIRPGINLTSIPEVRTITTGTVQYGLGLRVKLR